MGRTGVTSLSVDRIAVQAPGLSPEEARRLARLVADGLGGAVPPGTGSAALGSVAVRSAAAGAPVDELARPVLAEIAAELRRHL